MTEKYKYCSTVPRTFVGSKMVRTVHIRTVDGSAISLPLVFLMIFWNKLTRDLQDSWRWGGGGGKLYVPPLG